MTAPALEHLVAPRRRVYKYPLAMKGELQRVNMPREAIPLMVAEQDGVICIWAEIDDHKGLEARWFRIVGTGFDLATSEVWRGSALTAGGAYVWHVYELLS